jgi:Phage capsid family
MAPKVARRVLTSERTPYGEQSEHSWILDRAVTAGNGVDPLAKERLNRARAAAEVETRAITSATLGGLIPAVIEPWTAAAIAYGVRSTAPLSAALLRLDLPPVGMSAAWVKTTTAATVTNQTAENAALTASADVVLASATDPLGTIGASLDFSSAAQERSGGWFDKVIGEELGRAFGARLEQQIWAGTGSNGQLKGLTVMTGNSSDTVAGQTLGNQTAKIASQFSAVATNLGSVPDLVAMAPRRYAGLQSLTAAIGLPVENAFPEPVRENIVVSPAAPLTLGGGTEDWIAILNRGAIPLVANETPELIFQNQGSSAGALTFRFIIYAYAALGVSRRPEGVGLVKGATPPAF